MTWQAKWIGNGEEGGKNRYVEFRKVVGLKQEGIDGSLNLHVSARLEYQLWINGSFVGRGPSPCTPEWQYYDTYDVSGLLRAGDNVLAAVCYQFGESDIVTGQMQGEAGFWLQLESAGGASVKALTDGSWSCRISPRWRTTNERISRWGGFTEIYLAGEEDGWETAGYEESGWNRATVLAAAEEAGSPWPRLIPREIPFLASELRRPAGIVRVEANFGAVDGAERLLAGEEEGGAMAMNASKPGSMPAVVYDYERVVTGRPVLVVDAPEGGVIRLAYGESLELQEVDTFILKRGKQRLTTYGRRAGRFLKLTVMAAPSPLRIGSFRFEHTGYPYETSPTFSTGDSQIDMIHEVSLYTTRTNSQDHMEDCPWREKALWIVDAVVMAKIVYANFADTALIRKCLLQGARIQNDDGSIPGTGPEKNGMLLPDFCAYWLLGVEEYWRYSGDASLLRELQPAIDRLMAWFEAQTDETGLFARADRESWWCFIDWTDDIDRRDKVAAISFLYFKALHAYAGIRRALGLEPSGAEQALARADRLRTDIRRHLWDGERGMYVDCVAGAEKSDRFSLQTNFLAIWCGLMNDAEAGRFLDEIYFARTLPPVRGPFFQHIVLETLLAQRRTQAALQLIRDYWGEMLSRGATTWWETFDASLPSCTIPSTYQGHTPTYLMEGIPVSHCHAWGASPAYVLNRLVFGVDVTDAGKKVIRLTAPDLAFRHASAAFPLPGGAEIRIHWSATGTEVSGRVVIPDGYSVVREASYPLKVAVAGAFHEEAGVGR